MTPDHQAAREEVFSLLSGGAVFISWPETITSEEARDVREFFELVLRKIYRKVRTEILPEKSP